MTRLRDAAQNTGDDAFRALGGVGRHRGQTAHFFGDDGESMSMLAGAGRFHGRVEGEEL